MAHLTKFSGHCRYIVTDIDYTFIGRDRKMIQANLDAIRDAQAAGIVLAPLYLEPAAQDNAQFAQIIAWATLGISFLFRPLGYTGTNAADYREAERLVYDHIFGEMAARALREGKRDLTIVMGPPASGKTTAVRVLPVPGKDVGDEIELGGLLGTAPIMAVRKESAAGFIARGGRIPAPLQSLKN